MACPYVLPDPEGPRGETNTFGGREASKVNVVIGVKKEAHKTSQVVISHEHDALQFALG
jgi:hypothetical protein